MCTLEKNIGKTGRAFNTRLTTRATITAVKEHLKETGHVLRLENRSIIPRENNRLRRRIMEKGDD